MDILVFPRIADESPAKFGASRWSRWSTRVREWFGRVLNRTGVPGTIQNTTIEDGVTGQTIQVQVGALFTRITVNGRDYYFHRLSGKFDGTGSGCC